MHQLSSSEDGEEDSGIISDASSSCSLPETTHLDDGLDGNADHHRLFKSDSSNDETKKQIALRDRMRISRPMFQKADFLGEDLVSAVDEAGKNLAVDKSNLITSVNVSIIYSA